MHLLDMDRFLKEVLTCVKFPFDREDIRRELEDHILEKIEFYMEQGYDEKAAEEKSVNDMGNPKDIGKELNRQHNPWLGCLWKASNVLLVISVIISIFFTGFNFIFSLYSPNLENKISKDDIVYKIDVTERVHIDDVVLTFTSLIYDKDGNMNIFYEYYDKRLWGTGWSFDPVQIVEDDLGNSYFGGSGQGAGGLINKNRRTLKDFSSEAEKLIIAYDVYNRSFRLEIPLKTGDVNE
jgi:hypothetical protein